MLTIIKEELGVCFQEFFLNLLISLVWFIVWGFFLIFLNDHCYFPNKNHQPQVLIAETWQSEKLRVFRQYKKKKATKMVFTCTRYLYAVLGAPLKEQVKISHSKCSQIKTFQAVMSHASRPLS